MKIKISNYIVARLVEAGICQALMVTGGSAVHLNDGPGHQKGLHCIYNHHEQTSAMTAEAYARIHNKIAALCITIGPGGTNAITGVIGGRLDSVPMLVLSGQIRCGTTTRFSGVGIRAMGDQEFDICRSVECMTKYSEMILNPLRIRYYLKKTLYLTRSGRPGPCQLGIPLNIQEAFVDTKDLNGFDQEDYNTGEDGWADGDKGHGISQDIAGQGELRQVLPAGVKLSTAQEIVEKVGNARHPVINAGNGIRIAGVHEVFMEVAEKLGVPVIMGWDSEDCMYDAHPLYVGRADNMGDRPDNFAIQNNDLVLSIGSRLGIRQVGYNYKTWARGAYMIANDIDQEGLKKPSVHVDILVHTDARDLLEQLSRVSDALLAERGSALPHSLSRPDKKRVFDGGEGLRSINWGQTCAMWKERHPVVLPRHLEHGGQEPASVYTFIWEMSGRLREDQVTVVGNGSTYVVGGHAYMIKKGQRSIANSAIAAMGYGPPAAVSTWTASRASQFHSSGGDPNGDDLILITGDGSLQMNLQELQTIIHHRINIKMFVVNNRGYHPIRRTQKSFFSEPLVGVGVNSGDLSFPSLEKLVAACGYPYRSAAYNSELARAVEDTLRMGGPIVCEVFMSTDRNFESKSSAKRLSDGTMVSPPLEDLSPFLPEQEMDEDIIITRIKE